LLKQGVHAPAVVAPVPSLKVPFWHAMQPAEEPAVVWYVPGAQSVHVAAPRVLLNDPGAQYKHASNAAAPVVELNVPMGHCKHSVPPTLL
jgi:hypothetical protein